MRKYFSDVKHFYSTNCTSVVNEAQHLQSSNMKINILFVRMWVCLSASRLIIKRDVGTTESS